MKRGDRRDDAENARAANERAVDRLGARPSAGRPLSSRVAVTNRASLQVRRRIAVALLALCVAIAVAGAVGHGGLAQPSGGDGRAPPSEGTGADPSGADATLVVAVPDPDERAADAEERLLEVPVADGDEIVLNYTHSVEKTPVEDVYVVDGTDLRMDRTVFRSFGAGLPSTAEMNRTEDGFVVSVDRAFDRVYVSTGSVAGHELLVGDRCYDLVERSEAGTVALFVEADPPDEPFDPGNEAGESSDRRGECP